jgi:carbon monoxide dehydrogenase subunit G
MELVHDFVVPVPPDRAWDVLTDVQRIAPCLPGASVTAVDRDAFSGGMRIKLGPIGMTFRGQGAFVAKDPSTRRAVIEAKGRDATGNGGAQAHVSAALSEADGGAAVLLGQFVTNLATELQNRVLERQARRG